jgi:neutral ceramidase
MKASKRALAGVLVLLFAMPLSASQFKAGVAKVEITPPMPTPLAGYGERRSKFSTGVMDKIYCRALVISDGDKKVALVSNDILQILEDLKQEVSKNVSDLKLDGILLSSTHTHSGPGGYSDNPMVKIAVMGKYVPEYRKFLVAQVSRAIRSADKNMAPAQFGSVVAQAPGFAKNRRHEGGVVDPSLGIIKIADRSGKTIAYLINYAEHPTSLPASNLKISGDYAGVLESTLEEKDPGAMAMFFAGPLGDQGTSCKEKEDPVKCKDRLGSGLAAAVEKNAPAIALTNDVKISLFDQWYPVPELGFRKGCWTGVGWLMKRLGKDLERARGEFMAIEINDTLIYASAAELAVEVGFQLKALHPDKKEMVFAHSNDWLGYLLTPPEYDFGGYEACMSIYGREFEPYYVARFKELTTGVK